MAENRALPRFLVFGEALTDFVRTGEQTWHSVAGGSCWNVARVAATLGVAAAWCGAVSDDLFGQEIVRKSRTAGLDPRFLQVANKPPLIAVVHQIQPPQYFFLGGDSADLAFDEMRLPEGWEDCCELAHFGCISLVRQPLGARLVQIAERLKARGVRISFDPNYRNLMGPDYPLLFERMAALADILKISDEDMAGIYPGLTADAALARILALAPTATLLYTRGGAGLALHQGARQIRQAAFRVDVADAVGAGDSCLGGFIASLLSSRQESPAVHLRFAAATAAVVCTHAGAYAPSREEVDRLLTDGTELGDDC
ncbi:MAG: carbohydrate kinase [Nevskia sp.]|nr:carbohydrate kinase [Nevskia sp.]